MNCIKFFLEEVVVIIRKITAFTAAFILLVCGFSAAASEKITLDIFVYSKDNSKTYITQNAEVDYIASPLALLEKYCNENEISCEIINKSYLKSIESYKAGGQSGWIHLINDKNLNTTAAAETLKPGDKLVWFFAVTGEQWSGKAEKTGPSSKAVSSQEAVSSAASNKASSRVSSTAESKAVETSSIISVSEASDVSSEINSTPANKETQGDISGLYKSEYDEIIENQKKFLRKNPGSWTAFALGTFGYDIPNSIKNSIKSDIKKAAYITSVFDCQRLYFNARAAELDTSAIYKKAVNENSIEAATLNALIFGARVKYAETSGGKLFTKNQQNYFLSAQKSDGSFSLTEGFDGDIDVTAMSAAVLSLSDDEELKAAKVRAVDWLKLNTPEYSESAAQMLITGVIIKDRELCESALTALLKYKRSDGGFAHTAAGESDEIATEQALIALSSLKYEMNPYYSRIKPPLKAPSLTPVWIILSAVFVLFIGIIIFLIIRRKGRFN